MFLIFLKQEYFFHTLRKQPRITFFIVLKRYTKFWATWIEIYFIIRFKYIKDLLAKIKIPSKILHQMNYPRINNQYRILITYFLLFKYFDLYFERNDVNSVTNHASTTLIIRYKLSIRYSFIVISLLFLAFRSRNNWTGKLKATNNGIVINLQRNLQRIRYRDDLENQWFCWIAELEIQYSAQSIRR